MGKVVAHMIEIGLAPMHPGFQPGGGVLLHHAPDLAAGHGEDKKGIGEAVQPVNVPHGQAAGPDDVPVADRVGGNGHIHVQVIQPLNPDFGGVFVPGLQAPGGNGDGGGLDQVDGMGLTGEELGEAVPLPGGGAQGAVHGLAGQGGVGGDLRLQLRIRIILIQRQVPAAQELPGQGAGRLFPEADHRLGQLLPAPVDHQHLLSGSVFVICIGIAAAVVVSQDQQVDFPGFLNHAQALALGIGAENQRTVRAAQSPVIGDDDELAARLPHGGEIQLSLLSHGPVLVSRVSKHQPGIFLRQIPAGNV